MTQARRHVPACKHISWLLGCRKFDKEGILFQMPPPNRTRGRSRPWGSPLWCAVKVSVSHCLLYGMHRRQRWNDHLFHLHCCKPPVHSLALIIAPTQYAFGNKHPLSRRILGRNSTPRVRRVAPNLGYLRNRPHCMHSITNAHSG